MPPERQGPAEAKATTPPPTAEEPPPVIRHDPPPGPPPRTPLITLLLRLTDAYFDFDQDSLRPDAQTALRTDSSILKEILSEEPDATLALEGDCDERGSAEYNLALGARRAEMAKDFLVELGIPAKMLRTVSYGRERPQCTDETEACWEKNRRAHLSQTE